MKFASYKNLAQYDNHKVVYHIYDAGNNLNGFIAIHNTKLGPAVGGTRMYPYKSEKEALIDALRLSKAMTYKCAVAGVKFGGGKAVIISHPKQKNNKKLLKAFAKKIDELKGQFYTGEDVGISEENVQYMLTISPYFIGKKGQAGDPSPYAALSTFYAMKVAAKAYFGLKSLHNRSVAIKGVGKVGSSLVDLLTEEKAKIYIADIDQQAIKNNIKKYNNIFVVKPEDIHKRRVDIYSPCAMGNEFTEKNKTEIKAKIICGSANNQLEKESIGDYFFKQHIMYIPDYVANAGGLINVVDELEKGGYNKQHVLKKLEKVKDTVKKIISTSKSKGLSLNRVADQLAEEKFKEK